MRILYITEWFDPEPTPKGLSFVKHLQSLGHEVEVLTGFPSYPGGVLYPGYRQSVYQRQVMDGVNVLRVPIYPSHDRSPIRRIITYASYAFSSALLGPWIVKRFDLAYVYTPPATAGLAAVVFRVFFGKPFVYDIQDLWPDTLAATGMVKHGWMLKLAGAWCRLIYLLASHITVLSPGFKRKLIERGVPPEKITVVYNWADDNLLAGEEAIRKLPRAQEMSADTFNILFAGTMGLAQRLDSVLLAAQVLMERLPQVRFYFVGGGIEVENLRRKIRDMGLKNVFLLPVRPLSEMGPLFKAADVLLVHLKNDPLFQITIPSKTQAYLACAKPVLMAVDGDAATLVKRSSGGVTCRPEDPEDLVEKVAYLYHLPKKELEQMGRQGREFYEKELAMDVGVRSLVSVFVHSTGAGV